MIRTQNRQSPSTLLLLVSIPSSRGNDSDPQFLKMRMVVNFVSIPSSRGNDSDRWIVTAFKWVFKVSIPSSRGNDSDIIETENLVTEKVSIPSSRGNDSDTNSNLRKERIWRSLNPLKSGQWFGLVLEKSRVNKCWSLNPLKSGQWFGHYWAVLRYE